MTRIMCSHRVCRGKMEDVMAENLKRRLPFEPPAPPPHTLSLLPATPVLESCRAPAATFFPPPNPIQLIGHAMVFVVGRLRLLQCQSAPQPAVHKHNKAHTISSSGGLGEGSGSSRVLCLPSVSDNQLHRRVPFDLAAL